MFGQENQHKQQGCFYYAHSVSILYYETDSVFCKTSKHSSIFSGTTEFYILETVPTNDLSEGVLNTDPVRIWFRLWRTVNEEYMLISVSKNINML